MFYHTKDYTYTFTSTKPELMFMDLETTGLCKYTDTLTTLSILHYIKGHFSLYQWSISKKEEEILLLQAFLKCLSPTVPLYTYGGTHFELPFIEAKCQLYNLAFPTAIKHVDFKKLPLFSMLRKQGFTKRAQLENLVAFERTLSTPGKKIATIGTLSLSHPASQYTSLLLTHSEEEVYSLIRFYQLNQFLLALSHPHTLDLPTTLTPNSTLTFNGTVSYQLPFSLTLDFSYYHLVYTAHAEVFFLEVLPFKGTCQYTLPSKDYFIVGGELIHKSLATFIPSSLKRKAKAQECVLTKESLFFPCNITSSHPLWFNSFKHSFILFEPAFDSSTIYKTFTKFFKA